MKGSPGHICRPGQLRSLPIARVASYMALFTFDDKGNVDLDVVCVLLALQPVSRHQLPRVPQRCWITSGEVWTVWDCTSKGSGGEGRAPIMTLGVQFERKNLRHFRAFLVTLLTPVLSSRGCRCELLPRVAAGWLWMCFACLGTEGGQTQLCCIGALAWSLFERDPGCWQLTVGIRDYLSLTSRLACLEKGC